MLELLSPAGSPESVIAAVQSGADAIYLGYGDFNARRNAKNFSLDELKTAVTYCHLRGVKVYLTLNTLLTDRELPKLAITAKEVAAVGVDAILVQDMGVLRVLKQVCPGIPVHGSTQMTIHSLDGAKACADLGLTRVVLSRELSRDAIEHICTHSPIEIETFVHGALCMCYSGQCFFSSVIGGRSGNRGLCAQPCRLKYGWGNKADQYPLSLKDMSLAGHLQELRRLGISCLKIEGRMKRPEYVSVVTGIYSAALKEHREPTAEELIQLEQAFSRQGFTQGYYLNEQGKHMFGVREEKTPEPKELFAMARNRYQNGDTQPVPITFYAMIKAGEPLQVGVTDGDGHTITATGALPEPARTRPLTTEVVETQLRRTGGTPYHCQQVRALVEDGLSVPVSALNALRRQVLDDLTAVRTDKPAPELGDFHPGVRYENPKAPPKLTLSLRWARQLSAGLLDLNPHILYLPLDEVVAHHDIMGQLTARGGVKLGVTLPRICWDNEQEAVAQQLRTAVRFGCTEALIGNIGQLALVKEAGLTPRGDYGLGIFNSQAMKTYKRMGFASLTASFELNFPQIRDLSKAVDTELLVYGRLPLMVTEGDIAPNRGGQNQLTDRKGEHFPVLSAPGHRSEIFNAKKLFLADKQKDYQALGLWGIRLNFTTENDRECLQVAQRYLNQNTYTPNDYTRGLYYRAVD